MGEARPLQRVRRVDGTKPEMDAADFFNLATTEDAFMRSIIDHAVTLGWGEPINRRMTRQEKREALRPYHVTIAKRGAAGFPDLVMVRNGRQVFAELKREKKSAKLSVAQRKWLDQLLAVQTAIAATICVSSHVALTVPCDIHRRQAERIYGVYEWRPSDWPRIREVLA